MVRPFMVSKYLKEKSEEYISYLSENGYDSNVIGYLLQAIQTAISNENEIEYGLKLSAFGKSVIEEKISLETDGGTVWQLYDEYLRPMEKTYPAVEDYFDFLHIEAQNQVLDSYLLYLERYRDKEERFYLPKRKQFIDIGLIQGYQDTLDDKIDILTVSLPPGTGKAQPLYSRILTPNGFALMGDLSIGDNVISGDGNVSNVIGIYPQGKIEIYKIVLSDGSECKCSRDHLWRARKLNYNQESFTEDVIRTRTIEKGIELGETYYVPVFDKNCEHNQRWEKVVCCDYDSNDECQCIMIDDPCHLYITDDYIITHNTTIEKFFMSGVAGWFPKDYSLFFSHSGDITRMFYDGSLDIVTSSEYAWNEVFPDLSVTSTNAKMGQFNVGKYKPFPSVQTTSVGSDNAGKVRCSKYLLVDDMIAKLEQALNKNILDKLWGVYSVDARQRKTQDTDGKPCKEIHTATRWSVHDVIGRLQVMYEGNERVRCIAVPDINQETGESNFNYDFGGFTVAFFNDQALLMDDISYRCLYKNDPIEREGLLYHEDDLRTYAELPDREPDAIIGVCDTKSKGIDFMVLPVFYQYDNDYYMVDAVCDDSSDYGLQYEKLSNIIVDHKMQQCEFESNAGGDRLAHEVSKIVDEKGGRCNITTKPTETNKETRIIVNSDWVKKHCLFKCKDDYIPKSDYGRFMNQMKSYSIAGKNKHDDVVDCLANFALFVANKYRVRTATIITSPF